MSNRPFKLITEQPNYDIEFVMEEQNRESPKKLYAIGDLFLLNEKNKNRRRYLEEDMVPAIESYHKDNIGSGAGVGELNHSSKPEVDLERICHKIITLERRKDDSNYYKGKCQLLDTAQGRTLATLTESGVRWGFSSKCLGQIEESATDVVVRQPSVISVDAVFDPSIGKFSQGILENKEFIISDNGKISEAYDQLERKIAKYPSKHRDAINKHILESLTQFLKQI